MLRRGVVAIVAVILGRCAAQDCRSSGSSYRSVKVWQLRVPSSGSSTFVHALRSFRAASAADCVPHARCVRVAAGGGALASEACGRLRFARIDGHNPGHHHYGKFRGASGTNRATLASTTIRHPALWVASTRHHWRDHEAKWFSYIGEGNATGLPLDAYVETAFWNWNTFTRALAGNFSGDYVSGLFRNPPKHVDPRIARADAARAGADGALLATALARLEAMPFFVLVERYDASVALLRHATCLKTLYATRRCAAHVQAIKVRCVADRGSAGACRDTVIAARWGNATHHAACDDNSIADERTWSTVPADALTERVLAASRRYHALDHALYERATELFEERLAAMRRDRDAGIACRLAAPLLEDAACETVCYGA